ncbi:MAG: RpiB/LacA/LacB family sugar-phosphate isomerase [Thermodesulfobacteriota bacterium]|nr:RpiB/LacA/LacB family sugar-phosphate isomerase [Thermodesulfobacteriota bacterium]
MLIGLGADAYGYNLKECVKKHLAEGNWKSEDIGVFCSDSNEPYYDIANKMAIHVANGRFERGILFCGTGMGMAIIANKTEGVYASVCESLYAAQKSRSINKSNILTMGEFIVAPQLAKEMVDVWLHTEFTQGWPEDLALWLQSSIDFIQKLESTKFR